MFSHASPRHKRARENVQAMKKIWTKSKAEYHGEMVDWVQAQIVESLLEGEENAA